MPSKLNLNTQAKTLAMASVGAIFESYDFMICVFLSSVLIKVFYADHQFEGIFAIFTIAFFSRPLGGIFWGHLGDRYGRKKVFSITMLLLVVPTLLIALFPVHQVSVMTAGISFAVLRFLQGFLVGGEFPGGVTFIAEIAKAKTRGLFIAIFMSALTVGTLLASLVSLALNISMTNDQILAWGWRFPFILSIVLVIIAIYIRKQVKETTFFCKLAERKAIIRMPFLELVCTEPKLIFYGFILTCASAIGLTTIYTFLPQLLKFTHIFTLRDTLYLTTLGSLILCIAMPFFGYLSDKYKRKSVLILSQFGVTLSFALFVIASYTGSFILLLLGMLLISIFFAGVNANYCVILSEQFPTNIRYSGVALCYTMAYSICGGALPLLYLHVAKFEPHLFLPCGLFCLISLFCLIIFSKLKDFSGKVLQA